MVERVFSHSPEHVVSTRYRQAQRLIPCEEPRGPSTIRPERIDKKLTGVFLLHVQSADRVF